MKHKSNKGRKFGRTKNQRDAMFASMAASLIEHGTITTTEEKAKDLSKKIEPMITKARSGTIAVRRQLAKTLPTAAVKKLVDEVAPKFAERPGGYTRIIHLNTRQTDGAQMAKIELVD